MTRGLIIFFIITVIHLSFELNSDAHYQSKYPKYEFILHKCTASVQLNRKYQNEEISNSNSNKSTENFLHKAYISFTMRNKNSTSNQVHPATVSVNSKLDNNHPFNNTVTSYNNGSVKQFFTKSIENTPLRTLSIKSTRSSLPIFTKKDLLPELENITVKNKDSSHSVIVIKSVM